MNTIITVTASTITAPTGAVTSVFEFGPSGTNFGTPVTVTFPVPAGTTAATAAIYWAKPGSTTQWDVLPTTVNGPVATAQVMHFTPAYVGAACAPGTACTPANACHTGVTTCNGTPACADSGTNVADGTVCGTHLTCHAGACQAAGNACRSYHVAATIPHSAAVGPLAIGNFDGDDKPDIAVVSLWTTTGGPVYYPANTITIYYGDGTGTGFRPGPTAKTGDYPHQLEVATNVPGFPAGISFVISNAGTQDSGFSVFDSTLAGRRDFRSPYGFGDSRALMVPQPTFTLGSDTVFASTYVVEARFYEGKLQTRSMDDLTATFPTTSIRGNATPLCAFPTDMASADFNRDGFLDVLVACPNENGLRMYPFASKLTVGYVDSRFFATPAGPNAVAVGDAGRLFASSNFDAASVSLFVGDDYWNTQTTSRPYTRYDYATPGKPNGIVFADLDGDGALDLMVGYQGGIGIFYGDGVQPREPLVRIPVPGAYPAMVAGDLDGDGAKEIVVQVGNSIVILKRGATCTPTGTP